MQRAVTGKTGLTCFPSVTRSLFPVPQLEEPLDIGYDNRGAMGVEIGLNPVLLRFACGNKRLCAAEAGALDGANQSLLPAMICSADGIVAAFRHPVDILVPQRRPPKAWLPSAVNPDLISRTKAAGTSPRRKRYLVSLAALLAHDEPGDICRAVPRLPTGADMEDSQNCLTFEVLSLDRSLTQRRLGISTQTAEANTSTASTNWAITWGT